MTNKTVGQITKEDLGKTIEFYKAPEPHEYSSDGTYIRTPYFTGVLVNYEYVTITQGDYLFHAPNQPTAYALEAIFSGRLKPYTLALDVEIEVLD